MCVFLRSVLERMTFPSTCAGNYPSLPEADGEQSWHTSFAEPYIGVKDTADAVKRRIAVTSTPLPLPCSRIFTPRSTRRLTLPPHYR